jgi:hypothetical protein
MLITLEKRGELEPVKLTKSRTGLTYYRKRDIKQLVEGGGQ